MMARWSGRCVSVATVVLAAMGLSATVFAAEPSLIGGTGGKQDPASLGSTELAGQGAMATALEIEEEVEEAVSLDATEFSLGAGGIVSAGNARALAMTGTGDVRIRRRQHQFSANLAGNYGRAGMDKKGPWVETTRNFQGRVRYDAFFAKRWSVFGMATLRNDVFQGLDLRLNLDPGVAFYAIPEAKHRLWFELGYDFQYDVRTRGSILLHDDAGNIVLDDVGRSSRILARTDSNHAVRLFAGYVNTLNSHLSLIAGAEYLQSVLDGEKFRMNFDVGVVTQLKDRLSLALTTTLRYDNAPLPEVERLDSLTSIQLSYRFF